MIDTHTHLYFPDFGEELPSIMDNCKKIGVDHLILPNVDEQSIEPMKLLHSLYPEVTSMAMGLHPSEVDENWKNVFKLMEKELSSNKYKGIGEVGIDLYWDQSKLDLQKEAFEFQLNLAVETHLPVIIHSRSAFEETMNIIEKVQPDVPLIFHSFTGGVDDIKRIREGANPYFGINGVITFKNAQPLRDALPLMGTDKILLETDSPFLSPVPHRGKRNESSYLPYIRDKIAEVLNLDPQKIEKITDQNARTVFSIR